MPPDTNNNTKTFLVTEEDAPQRIDAFLSERVPELSRSLIKTLITKGLVAVDNKSVKPSHKVVAGEEITIEIPAPAPTTTTAEDIPIEILHEDADIIIVNKAQGMVMHPGAGMETGTLVNALLHHTKDLSTIGGPLRPGIVHRIDKDTSGVIVIAKTNKAHLALIDDFKAHTTTRRYHAVVWGVMKDNTGTIDISIGRDIADRKKISTNTRAPKDAVTHYKVLKCFEYFTLLELTLETGRTHQIRVHLATMNHPIVGDKTYTKRTPPSAMAGKVKSALKSLNGQLLHAMVLGFTHPTSGEYVEFSSPYPKQMAEFIELLET